MKKFFSLFDYFFAGFAFIARKKVFVIFLFILFIVLLKINSRYQDDNTYVAKLMDYFKNASWKFT